jgi:hypothetical protein
MIVLNRAEAEYVLGLSPTHPESALEPAPLMDGSYVLPDDVLDDEANADVVDYLTDRVVPGDPDPALVWDFGPPDDPDQEAIDLYNSLKLTWSEPQTERASPARSVTKTGRKTGKR